MTNTDLGQQTKKILKKGAGLSIEEVGILVAEIHKLRHQAAGLGGAKHLLKEERDQYKGAYFRLKEALANAYAGTVPGSDLHDDLSAAIDAIPAAITPEEKKMLFGVENRARRQDAANFELGKSIAGMIRRGTHRDRILEYLEKRGLAG